MSEHDPPAPVRKSTVTELPRIVGLVHEHRPKPAAAPTVTELPRIEGRAAPPAPALAPSVDELSVDAELRGVKVRAGARGAGIAALQRVLIVLILVAGTVAIVRSFAMSPEALDVQTSAGAPSPRTPRASSGGAPGMVRDFGSYHPGSRELVVSIGGVGRCSPCPAAHPALLFTLPCCGAEQQRGGDCRWPSSSTKSARGVAALVSELESSPVERRRARPRR
jgi:hypothetical protein